MNHDPLDIGSTQRQLTPGCLVFNRHELTERLAIGRKGDVWKARDPKLADMQVVLKLSAGSTDHGDLKTGMDAICDLTHPNILRTYGLTGDEDLSGIIMEYVKGQTLAQALRAKESSFFEISEVKPWAMQLFSALQFAWDSGRLAHGDLRLANLYVTTGGSLKVAEFCYAPLRKNRPLTDDDLGSGALSLPCLSPQALSGEVPVHADDIYAAGACLYELLTGKPVFMTGNVVAQIQNKIPPTISERRQELGLKGNPVPKEWESLIARCLAKERADRPSNAAEVVRLIEGIGETSGTSGRKLTQAVSTAISAGATRSSWLWSPPMLVGAAVAILVTGVYLLMVKPNHDALAALKSAREQLDRDDSTTAPALASDRLSAWQKFISAHALKPVAFTDEDEAALMHASSRVTHYQGEVSRLAEAEAERQQQATTATNRLARAIADQKQADTSGKFSTSERLGAWGTLLKTFSAADHPETKAFTDYLSEASRIEKQWQQKHADEKKKAEEEAAQLAEMVRLEEQKASRWQQDRNSSWAAVQTQCVDPLVSAFVKVQQLAAFLPTLAEPPKGAEKRAEELRSLALAEQKKALDATAAETPKSPLKLADLLADSPVKDQPDNIKKAYVMLSQQKLAETGHYKSKPDGDHGPGSHSALVEYQKSKQLVASAKLDAPTAKALGLDQPDLAALAEQANKMRSSTGGSGRNRPPPKEEEKGFWRKVGERFRDAGVGIKDAVTGKGADTRKSR